MTEFVIEGTFAEALARLNAPPFKPEARLRVIVENEGVEAAEGHAFSDANLPKEKRNGVTLFPIKVPGAVLTTEMVNALLEDE